MCTRLFIIWPWPGNRLREIVLLGMLPAAVRDRWIGVEVTECTTGHTVRTREQFSITEYGEYVLRLPESMDAGLYRMPFTVGVWSPGGRGADGDSRQLGFFLKAVGLR